LLDSLPPHRRERKSGDIIAERYVLVRELGEGAMGVVWVAHSTALDVDVALKLLRRELAGTQAVERMAREARTAAQLGHPALVRVLDFGTSELGEPFLIMELLEGDQLHALLVREGRLPAERAVGLMLPIIDGLGTAHEKGIVHRDVKPENIFIARDEQGRIQPKVLDFGIAKLVTGQKQSRLTQLGAVVGSPQYLSPEQAEGLEDVDLRCDVWAVGVVIYELITGAPPFDANNFNALMRKILRDVPIPITELAAGDRHLWTILERCLRKDPDERWASMWELGEALALWLFERGVRSDAASRSLRQGWLDGGITGVQVLVTSEAPDAPTLPPKSIVRVEPGPPNAADTPPVAAVGSPATRSRARAGGWRQRWILASLLGVVAVAAAGGLLISFLGGTTPASEKRATVIDRRSATTPPAAAPTDQGGAQAAPAPSATEAPAPPEGQSTSPESSAREAQPAPRGSVKPLAPATRTSPRSSSSTSNTGRRDPDFGF
jgi:eukaryotic-like serine/threonine-protein kinase